MNHKKYIHVPLIVDNFTRGLLNRPSVFDSLNDIINYVKDFIKTEHPELKVIDYGDIIIRDVPDSFDKMLLMEVTIENSMYDPS